VTALQWLQACVMAASAQSDISVLSEHDGAAATKQKGEGEADAWRVRV
jgi:hypothetical protein